MASEHFSQSSKTSFCPWKGTASYWDAAAEIKDRVAFWRGVEVVE